MQNHSFTGFPPETFRFLQELKVFNEREWFEAHRGMYEAHVLQPAQTFVVDMGKRLETLAPGVVAIPKIDKTIFRIHRDVRFSPNKAPYKTHLAMFFWEGNRKKMENPGFYVHLEPGRFFIGVGMYQFPKDILQEYRQAVADDKMGNKLARIIREVVKHPGVKIGGRYFKRVPRGFDPDHPRAELLLHNGLHAYIEENIPDAVYSEAFVEYCFEKFTLMAPVHYWLREMMESDGDRV